LKEDKFVIDDNMKEALRACASENPETAGNARKAFAAQLVAPIRKAVIVEGNTIGNIYSTVNVNKDEALRYPIDIINPDHVDDFSAYVMPRHGGIPEKHVDGDEIFVKTYKIENSIDWDLDLANDANWDVVGRAIKIFRDGFTKKLNDDGWKTILYGAYNGGTKSTITCDGDSSAVSGIFSHRLVSKAQNAMARIERGAKLTDLYVSPEAFKDLRDSATYVNSENFMDDRTRYELLQKPGSQPTESLFGVRINELYDFGAGQAYQNEWTSITGDSTYDEIGIGFDLTDDHRDSFVFALRGDLEVFDDMELHKKGRMGVYGWMRVGFAVLNANRLLSIGWRA